MKLKKLILVFCLFLTLGFITALPSADGGMDIPPHIQQIMQKAMSGKPLTPAEQQAMEEWTRSQQEVKKDSLSTTPLPFVDTPPPHVQKIMNKAMSGEELTPQEKKELEKWGQSVSDSAKRSAEGYQDLPGKALEALGFVNCPKKRSVKIPSKPLTREGYISIVEEIAKDYGKRAKKGKSAVDVSLASAEKARDGANLGAALMMMGAGSASVYATAWAAIKDPDDPITANNLGAILRNMNDHVRAIQILRYAESIRPDTPLSTINLAWSYFDIGDMTTAKGLFEKALRFSPDLPDAHQGLGFIYSCQGSESLAMEHLYKSLVGRFSSSAAHAYMVAGAKMEVKDSSLKVGDASTSRGRSSFLTTQVPASSSGFTLPSHPINGNIAVDALLSLEIVGSIEKMKGRITRLKEQTDRLREIVQGQYEATLKSGEPGVDLYRTFEKEQFLFDEITDLVMIESPEWRRARQNGEKLQQDVDNIWAFYLSKLDSLTAEAMSCGNDLRCQDRVIYQICLNEKKKSRDLHSAYYENFHLYWTAFKGSSLDYWAFTNTVLERVYNPSHNELLNKERELQVVSNYTEILTQCISPTWMAAAYAGLECVPPGVSAAAPVEEPATEDKGPDCRLEPPVKLKFKVVSFQMGCEKVKIEVGQGLKGSLEYDSSKKTTTYFVGAGIDAGIPGLGVEGKTGFTLTESNGKVTDFGMESSLSKTVGYEEVEVVSRITIMGGPSVETEKARVFGL